MTKSKNNKARNKHIANVAGLNSGRRATGANCIAIPGSVEVPADGVVSESERRPRKRKAFKEWRGKEQNKPWHREPDQEAVLPGSWRDDNLRGPQMTIPHWVGPTPLSEMPAGWHLEYDKATRQPVFWHDSDPSSHTDVDPRLVYLGDMDGEEAEEFGVQEDGSAYLPEMDEEGADVFGAQDDGTPLGQEAESFSEVPYDDDDVDERDTFPAEADLEVSEADLEADVGTHGHEELQCDPLQKFLETAIPVQLPARIPLGKGKGKRHKKNSPGPLLATTGTQQKPSVAALAPLLQDLGLSSTASALCAGSSDTDFSQVLLAAVREALALPATERIRTRQRLDSMMMS